MNGLMIVGICLFAAGAVFCVGIILWSILWSIENLAKNLKNRIGRVPRRKLTGKNKNHKL